MAKKPPAPDLLALPESPAEMRRRWRDPGFRAAWPMPDAEAPWLGRPGPSFEAYASALAGGVPEPPPRNLRGKAREEAAADAAPALAAFAARRRWALHFAYLRALYDPTFTLPVNLRGTMLTAQCVPGMRHVHMGVRHGPGTGARVVVVGKCPGVEEEQHGINFVGPASDDLYRALRELDLADVRVVDTRDRRGGGERSVDFRDIGPIEGWYWTNLCRWRNLDPSAAQLRGDWIKDCRPLLRMELHLLRPDFLLCLGSEASKELLGPKASVTALIGRIMSVPRPGPPAGEDPSPILAAAVVHPAAVARKPELYPDLLQGLTAFKQLVDGTRKSDVDPALAHETIHDVDRLREVVDRIVADGAGIAQPIAVDCEWHGKHPGDPKAYLRTVQFCHRPREAYCVVLRAAGGRWAFDGDVADVREQLSRLLKSDPTPGGRRVRFGGHFIRADLPWLLAFGVDARAEAEVAATVEASRSEGGWDTAYLAHAYQEAIDGGYKLEALAARFCGVSRYDVALQAWKEDFCKSRGLKAGQLDGYGSCPDFVLHPYAIFDVDATLRLFLLFNGEGGAPGLVDGDRRGLAGREGYWNNMIASPAALEMEGAGLFVDRKRVDELTRLYEEALDLNTASFRADINWGVRSRKKRDRDGKVVRGPDGKVRRVLTHPAFNVGSADHCREWLYGVALNGKRDKETGEPRRLSPPGVITLDMTPVKAAGPKAPIWEKVLERGIEKLVNASTDRETLGILANTNDARGALVGKLRDLRFLGQVLKGTLRPPAENHEGLPVVDLRGNLVYEGGLAYHTGHDGRVRTHFGVVETSRWSSWAPNLQNLCLDAHTSILTRRGWVSMPAMTAADEVAQYWPDTKAIDFVKPEIVVRHHKGEMVHLKTDKQIDLLVTPEHRCLLGNRNTGRWFETPAAQFRGDRLHFHAGRYVGGTKSWDQKWVTWLCAVQADGSYVDKGGIRFCFAKERKLTRLRATLGELGVVYSESPMSASSPATRIYVGLIENAEMLAWTREVLGESKQLGPWLLDLDRATLDLFVEELFLWDGLSTRKTEYSSSDKPNADWAQALFALSGIRARMREYRNSNPNARVHHCVDIPARRVDYSMTTNFTADRVPWDDKVYCVTVPSQFIVVRRDGKVSITGNSKGREEDYQRILGKERYLYPIRSMLMAGPRADGVPTVLVEADYKMAEMAILGWLACDPAMAEHVHRNTLAESDPSYLDLHSLTAIAAFRLDTPENRATIAALIAAADPKLKGLKLAADGSLMASKLTLKALGRGSLRVAAKNVNFGVPYQRSAEAIARQCREQGAAVPVAQAQELIDNYFATYPAIATYLEACKARVLDPGWIVGTWGHVRRAEGTRDQTVVAEQQRQFCNFPVQNAVAGAINLACRALFRYRRRHGDPADPARWFTFTLQIHDALLFEVPVPALEWFMEEVLERCMSRKVAIRPRDLDGVPIEGAGTHHLAIDSEVMRHWGIPPDPAWAATAGVPEAYYKH